ncbi:MAG: hypothetical protein U0930_03410 [Pirellulales bacterium]
MLVTSLPSWAEILVAEDRRPWPLRLRLLHSGEAGLNGTIAGG